MKLNMASFKYDHLYIDTFVDFSRNFCIVFEVKWTTPLNSRYHCGRFGGQLDILKPKRGHYSECFLFQKVYILKGYNSEVS